MKVLNIKSFAPVGVTQQNRASGVKNNPKCDVFVKSNDISFGSNATIAAKLDSFLPDLYNYILHSKKLSLEGVGEIAQNASPGLLVKSLKDAPVDAASSSWAASYNCAYSISSDMKTVSAGAKSIYLGIPDEPTVRNRLVFMNDVAHEMTHIFQEESCDRISKLQFIQKFLDKELSNAAKLDTLKAMAAIFNEAETKMQQPLLRALNKKDIIPCPVKTLSHKLLNDTYIEDSHISVDDYIKGTILSTMDKFSSKYADMDRNTILEYMQLTAKNEREAYLNSGYLVKRALGIKSPVDTEYRVLLYDRFANVAAEM